MNSVDDGVISTIGSPNFGFRSEFRDNELQFYMFSKNISFVRSLENVKLCAYFKLYDILFSHLKLCFDTVCLWKNQAN